MYELVVESKFSAAHQLRGYQGKCEKLHGHNWRVTCTVTAERLNEQGLAIDFVDIKKALREVLDQLEHTFLNEIFPFTQINPSSENVAKWIYDNLSKRLNTEDLGVSSVTVWESDTASARRCTRTPRSPITVTPAVVRGRGRQRPGRDYRHPRVPPEAGATAARGYGAGCERQRGVILPGPIQRPPSLPRGGLAAGRYRQ